jgi:hypothetical protein
LPRFAAHSEDAEIGSDQLRDQAHILLFLSAGCGPCQTLADEMADADLGSLADQLIIVTSARQRAAPAIRPGAGTDRAGPGSVRCPVRNGNPIGGRSRR